MREHGVITLTDSEWAKAKQRHNVIGRLAKSDVVGRSAVEEAAAQLALQPRRIYQLIKQCKAGSGLVTDHSLRKAQGGKGRSRIAPQVEVIIAEVLKTFYLSRQKRSRALITREIRKRCKEVGHQTPSYNTIDLRIAMLDPMLVTRKRHGADATRRLQAAAGETPEAAAPLDVVQMDHTKTDVIVVDEATREPVGRPSLTLGIDVFSRCIVGMLLTLEAPSATSVGLCLAQMVTDKSAWLERLGLDTGIWPMHGKPKKIHMDNASEFKSEALKRGCEQHGIDRDYRPKGQPQFGGIIERVIGTAMTMAHEVPGTTFSNLEDRGTYKSEAKAILTLKELEKWLVLAIGTYHQSVHGSLLETPAAVWKRNIQSCPSSEVSDKQAFLIDFLPVIERSITRVGFVIDHITYYADVLKPWIARRDRLDKFIIRRDPRDISRVWVLDPDSRTYFELPYRCQSRSAVTIWEHKQAVERLRKQGREQIDEAAIFRMIDQMREITETAAKERKRARRDKNRRSHLGETKQGQIAVPTTEVLDHMHIKPFPSDEWNDCVDETAPADDDLEFAESVKIFPVEEW